MSDLLRGTFSSLAEYQEPETQQGDAYANFLQLVNVLVEKVISNGEPAKRAENIPNKVYHSHVFPSKSAIKKHGNSEGIN